MTILPQPSSPQPKGNIAITATLGSAQGQATKPFVPKAVIGSLSIKNNNYKPSIVVKNASPDSTITVKFPDNTIQTGKTNAEGDLTITSNAPQGPGVIDVTDSFGGVTGKTHTITYAPKPAFGTLSSLLNLQNKPQIKVAVGSPDTAIKVTFPDGSSVTAKTNLDGDITTPMPSSPQVSGNLVVTATLDGHTISKTMKFSPVSYIGTVTTSVVNGSLEVTVSKAAPESTIIVILQDGTPVRAKTNSEGDVVIPLNTKVLTGAINVTDNADNTPSWTLHPFTIN